MCPLNSIAVLSGMIQQKMTFNLRDTLMYLIPSNIKLRVQVKQL